MALPVVERRHLWLRFETMGLSPETEADYVRRLRAIFFRKIFRVSVLDFEGVGMVNGGNAAGSLRDRLEMVVRNEDDDVVFRSYAWESLFGIDEPLIKELMLEFFSTVYYRETDVELDTTDTLVFRVGGVDRQMSMQQFILAMCLHTEEEIGSAGFTRYWTESLRVVPDRMLLGDYWERISSGGDSTTGTPSYTFIREPLRRLCHRMIALTIAGRGQSPEKVTTLDLFLLRSMDEGLVVNIPHFLAHYLHRGALGRDMRRQMTGGHFVSRLARHLGVIGDEI